MSVLVVRLWLLAQGRCWLTPVPWLSTAHCLRGFANHLWWHGVSGQGHCTAVPWGAVAAER